MGSPIDWDEVREVSKSGRLMELLSKLPKERWMEHDGWNWNFLHYAAVGSNVATMKVLIKSGLDVNAICKNRRGKPAHIAVYEKQPQSLELLCAAGSDMRRDAVHESVLDYALGFSDVSRVACIQILIGNGARLNTADKCYGRRITPDLIAFEKGVLCCRSAVASLLRVKRVAKLWNWDKFLLKEIAICVWATRYDEEWTI